MRTPVTGVTSVVMVTGLDGPTPFPWSSDHASRPPAHPARRDPGDPARGHPAGPHGGRRSRGGAGRRAGRRRCCRRGATRPRPGNFTGYGFDQCLAPTQAKMNSWLQHSPFLAVGIYISGDSRACRHQPNLTPRWIATQLSKGWRLLPITLGPQASCQPRFPRYRDDFKISPAPGGANRYPDRPQDGHRRGQQDRAGRQGARHRAGLHALVRPRGLRRDQSALPRVGAGVPEHLDPAAAQAPLRLRRLLERRLGHQGPRRRPGEPAERLHAAGPDLDRSLGRRGQHLDVVHP